MGKEVDFEALAAQYIWKHLEKLNMGAPILRRWSSDGFLMNETKKAVLFTIRFTSVVEKSHEELNLPVAILTEDKILKFLVGSGTVDLRGVNSQLGGYCIS